MKRVIATGSEKSRSKKIEILPVFKDPNKNNSLGIQEDNINRFTQIVKRQESGYDLITRSFTPDLLKSERKLKK